MEKSNDTNYEEQNKIIQQTRPDSQQPITHHSSTPPPQTPVPPSTLSYPSSPPPPPPPPPPPTYYYPQQPPPSMYSWEVYPYTARELMKPKEGKNPILVVIGVFLIITSALEFPIAGLLVYYASSEGLDFGGTLTLQGKVVGEDGTNLSGVRISIVGTSLSSVSDANGDYTLRNAPNGIWKIKASRIGYSEEAHKVLIHQDFTDTVDFKLEEGSGSEEINDLWFFFSLSIMMVMFSGFIIAGSIYSIKRKRFSVVLVGAILGMFTMTPSMVLWFIPAIFMMSAIGFMLSASALLMIVLNRKAFKRSEHVPSQEKGGRLS